MNVHDRCLLLVASALDFDLEPAERDLIDRHLATCPTCPAVAAALAADAATIAALPRPVRTAPAALRPRPGPLRLAQPSFRLVAIAALLALLALGALAAGGELIRRLEDSTRLALNPSPAVPTLIDGSGPPAPSGPSGSAGPIRRADAARVRRGTDRRRSGGQRRCLGRRVLRIRADPGHRLSPVRRRGKCLRGMGAAVAELSVRDRSSLSRAGRDAPLLAYAHDGDVPVERPPDGPDSVDGQPVNGLFARAHGPLRQFGSRRLPGRQRRRPAVRRSAGAPTPVPRDVRGHGPGPPGGGRCAAAGRRRGVDVHGRTGRARGSSLDRPPLDRRGGRAVVRPRLRRRAGTVRISGGPPTAGRGSPS